GRDGAARAWHAPLRALLRPSRGLAARPRSGSRRVRRRPPPRVAHRAGAARRRPVPAVGRTGRAAAQDLLHRRRRSPVGAVAHSPPRGRWRDHLGRGAPPGPGRSDHGGHAPYPRGDTRFSAGGASGARVRWPPEVRPMIIIRGSLTLGALALAGLLLLMTPGPARAHRGAPAGLLRRCPRGPARARGAAPVAPEWARILEALETAFVSVADRVMPAV